MELRRIGAAIAACVLLLGFGAAITVATQPTGHKVVVCHATNSATHPYTRIEVDIAAAGNKYLDAAGHNSHTGPVWAAGLKDQKTQWGDIIPPYTYDGVNPPYEYPGLNWTDGEAIWDNDCLVPNEVVTAPPAESASPTPSFEQSVEAATDVPTPVATQPDTATTGSSSGPGTSWLVAALLGVAIASVILLTPSRAGTRR